ncbi:MAG TPA: cysteine--tRNA ligase [Candidatus Limnocylindria bacterium]|nr:cysteine--tRNA ligase [Candidatus Limnocylindria bacterium]
MKLHNTLTRKIQVFKPLHTNTVRLYSCGPTVYNHAHIGNLSSYIFADTLRRTLQATGYTVQHVMNFTDVDDKTIRRSAEQYPDMSPEEALQKLTGTYKQIFLGDMAAIGNDTSAMKFVSATDSIEGMRALITDLYTDGFAYIAEDGVYFSIEKYKQSGKKYGQLLKLDSSNTSAARIDNDEYDKESVHDFALWKTRKGDEPAWEFELDGHELLGRPGWHIECSVMSDNNLGQPFDIHTGGVDLIFPHHENEIAQSTAGKGDVYATYFVHNEHLLVDGKKMSKSLGNFFTLQDVRERGYDPLAFRLLVLQSHYRNQSNFTWENLGAAQNRLQKWQAMADLVFQPVDSKQDNLALQKVDWQEPQKLIKQQLGEDLNTPEAITWLDRLSDDIEFLPNDPKTLKHFKDFLAFVDRVFGLNLSNRTDITPSQKDILKQRQKARNDKEWAKSDQLRDELKEQGIEVRDTAHGQIWHHI